MAPNESPPTRQVPPLQFIIALLFVKSKPSTLSCTGEQRHSPALRTILHLSLTEFRKQIASFIRREARSRSSAETDAHADTNEDVDTFEEMPALRDRNSAGEPRHSPIL